MIPIFPTNFVNSFDFRLKEKMGNPSNDLQSSYCAFDSNNRSVGTSRGGSKMGAATGTSSAATLNDTIQTEHLDVPYEDSSIIAHITRTMTRIVATLLSPKQVLSLLRVLKAITLSFLVLTILSDIMYILFVELVSDKRLRIMAGGHRDTIIRIYGLALSGIGLAIELDYTKVVRKVSGFKGFIPRSLLYFFIMQITGSHPIMLQYNNSNNNNNKNVVYNDDGGGDGDGDDATYEYDADIPIPSSAIGFQRVTAFVL